MIRSALYFHLPLEGNFNSFWCCSFTAGSRPPLILQSPPPYAPSPREGGPLQNQQLQQRKKGPAVKEEKDLYDIVSSPNKDSTKLTLKLSRVKSNESDTPGKHSFGTAQSSLSPRIFVMWILTSPFSSFHSL